MYQYKLKFFIIPIFDFIWVYIINFQGRFLAILFQLKNKEQYLNDPEYKAKVDSEIGKVREESFQEFKKLNKQITIC